MVIISDWHQYFFISYTVRSNPKNLPLLATLTHHYDELVDYVRRKFGGRDFAADIVHDLCVHLIERPHLADIEKPLAYLRRATTNEALNRIRNEKLRSEWVDVVDELPDHSHHVSGEYVLEFKQNVIKLQQTIQGLPARARQVFLLHRIHGMSQDEIARELEISRNMVTQHYRRAITEIAEKWPPLQQYYLAHRR